MFLCITQYFNIIVQYKINQNETKQQNVEIVQLSDQR